MGQGGAAGKLGLLVLGLLLTGPRAGLADTYQGFGAATPGGAGKTVRHVTTLASGGVGSLRNALSLGSGTIVFDVGGEIVLSSEIPLRGSYVTIDGLTAPAPGITIRGYGLRIDGTQSSSSGTPQHDIIVRGIRVRSPFSDGITVKNLVHDIVIDHVSVDACGDGSIDVTNEAHDVTVSWSTLAHCAKNMLIKYRAQRVTVHHNVFVASQWRNPWLNNLDDGTPATDLTADVRNNLVWDWGTGGGSGVECGATANLADNFYSSPESSLADQERAVMVLQNTGCKGLAYTAGNFSADNLPIDVNAAGTEAVAFPAAFVNTTSACVAAADALASAGVRPLDSLDEGTLSAIVLPGCTGEQTLKLQIGERLGDVEEIVNQHKVQGARTTLKIGVNEIVGFRFPGVPIPNGAEIESAVLKVYSKDDRSKPVFIRYLGEKSADSAPLGRTPTDLLSVRPQTVSVVDDSPAPWTRNVFSRSPELAAIVQEIVDQPGWQPGNSLTLLIADNGSTNYRQLGSFDDKPERAAILTVTYRIP